VVEGSIEMSDGRTVGFAEFGAADGVPVVWCHGGPGSRRDPEHLAPVASAAGLRIVGIDRPGYGRSTPQPGRTIASWVPDALAVADAIAIDRFVAVGCSTGGAFALATAVGAPERVRGVVAVCSMSDMRWAPARATMSPRHAHAVWNASDRVAAIRAAVDSHGLDGSRIFAGDDGPPLAPSDLELFRDADWAAAVRSAMPAMFTYGLEGYADDRIADGVGWTSFDVSTVACPVIVLHGRRDVMVDVIHAEHTAAIVPGAELRVFDELGHFSIEREIMPAVLDLLRTG
jgi:pimeloyl-ACP methyl ester carboxylesterase